MGAIDIDNEGAHAIAGSSSELVDSKFQPVKPPIRSGVKVPDFPSFRKKLFIGGALGIAFITFMVWAIWFAPAATVIITAKTEPAPISVALTLGGTAATDTAKGIVQTVVKQIKKDISVDFTATGKKDLGEKASGSITIRNCDYPSGFTLDAGSEFITDSDQVYVSKAVVTVPGFTGLPSACNMSGNMSGKATVLVQASASGETYNNGGVSYAIKSIPSAARVDAIGSAMAGGTTRMATIVMADDIAKANQALIDLSTDSVKQQLTKQFINGEVIVTGSFTVDRVAAVSVPAVDVEAVGGKAKLTSATTFSLTAIAKSEVEAYLKVALTKQIADSKTQRIYNDGLDKVVLSGYLKTDQSATINISTVGQIGPNIDQAALKNQIKGKRYGDVQALIENIPGVSSADIKFSYFWVTTVPGSVDKIDVQFTIKNA
jgi:hypothetical protein